MSRNALHAGLVVTAALVSLLTIAGCSDPATRAPDLAAGGPVHPYVETIRVRVVDADGGPVAGARVTMEPPVAFDAAFALSAESMEDAIRPNPFSVRSERSVTSDAEGWVAVRVSTSGGTGMRIEHPDFALRQVVLAGGRVDHERRIALEPGTALTVRVFDVDGRPVEGARVSATPEIERARGSIYAPKLTERESLLPPPDTLATSDATGTAVLPRVGRGEHTIWLAGPDGDFAIAAWAPDGCAHPVHVSLPRPVRLHGTARDATTGDALPGVDLTIHGRTMGSPDLRDPRVHTQTGTDGVFAFSSHGTLQRGRCIRRVTSSDPAWSVRAISVRPPGARFEDTLRAIRIDVELEPSATVTGTVRAKGEAIAEAWVAAWSPVRGLAEEERAEWEEVARVATDAQGRFRMPGIPPGEVLLLAGAVGYRREGARADAGPLPGDFLAARERDWVVNAPSGETTQVEVDLVSSSGAPAPLRGRVLYEDGSPAAHLTALVMRKRPDGGKPIPFASTRTALDGSFRVPGLAPEEVANVVVAPASNEDPHWMSPRFEFRDGRCEVRIEDRLQRFRGQVVTARGDPVAGARIGFVGQFLRPGLFTDEQGRFDVRRPRAAFEEPRVHAWHADVGAGSVACPELEDGGMPGPLQIVLEEQPRIRGTIVDALDGTPVSGARVGPLRPPGLWLASLVGRRPSGAAFLQGLGVNDDGTFAFPRHPGPHPGLFAGAIGYVTQPVELGSGPDAARTIRLAPLRRIAGRIARADGTPVVSARVLVRPTEERRPFGRFLRPPHRTLTLADGEFVFDVPGDVEHVVHAFAIDGEPEDGVTSEPIPKGRDAVRLELTLPD